PSVVGDGSRLPDEPYRGFQIGRANPAQLFDHRRWVFGAMRCVVVEDRAATHLAARYPNRKLATQCEPRRIDIVLAGAGIKQSEPTACAVPGDKGCGRLAWVCRRRKIVGAQ